MLIYNIIGLPNVGKSKICEKLKIKYKVYSVDEEFVKLINKHFDLNFKNYKEFSYFKKYNFNFKDKLYKSFKNSNVHNYYYNLSLKKIKSINSNNTIFIDNGGLQYNNLKNLKKPIYIQYNNFEDFLKGFKDRYSEDLNISIPKPNSNKFIYLGNLSKKELQELYKELDYKLKKHIKINNGIILKRKNLNQLLTIIDNNQIELSS